MERKVCLHVYFKVYIRQSEAPSIIQPDGPRPAPVQQARGAQGEYLLLFCEEVRGNIRRQEGPVASLLAAAVM